MITTKSFLQQHFELAYYEPSYIILSEYESVLEETFNLIHDIDVFQSVMLQLIKETGDKVFGNLPIVNYRTGYKLLRLINKIPYHNYIKTVDLNRLL